MSDQNWRPTNAEDDGCAVLITYRNEAGEEHVHVADSWGVDLDSSILHTHCAGVSAVATGLAVKRTAPCSLDR